MFNEARALAVSARTPQGERLTVDDALTCLEYLSGFCVAAGAVTSDVKERWAGVVLALVLLAARTPDLPHPSRQAILIMAKTIFPGFQRRAPVWLLGPLIGRDDPRAQVWRRAVLKRDGGKCQSCGSKSDLHAHHIQRWVDAPSLRLVVGNGMALCAPCHIEVHRA